METHEDIIKHLEGLLKALNGDDYRISSSPFAAKDLIKYNKIRNRLTDCLFLLKNDLKP